MKKYLYIIPGILFALLLISSCNQVEESGHLQFGLDLSEEGTQKATSTDESQVVAALVSVQDVNGAMIYDKERLELLRFGDQFVTKSLKLPVGEFMLTEFMLINDYGMVLWATPKEGSKLAHLVRNPLPIYFGIHPDETTSLDIQVIRVNDHPPEDFGYAQFNIEFVDRFCLKVHYTSMCQYAWNDSLRGPEGDMMPYYQPRLIIRSGNRVLLDEPMIEGLNYYKVPRVSEWYLVSATGCWADIIFEQKFHLEELAKHRCGPDYLPLMIGPEPNPDIIITPEGLYEPTIKQGVFGSIQLPIDSYMVEDGTDIWPVVRDIYFFPYYVLDSIYTFAPIDCYFPIEMIAMEPVAIVRTNSEGYFQAPMRVGEYMYLVKMENGYYMDAFISSHRPGHVMVYPGEVTYMEIHWVDCSMWADPAGEVQ